MANRSVLISPLVAAGRSIIYGKPVPAAHSYRSEDGDLFLGMRLEGVNPDLDPNQPVVLNLNLESNIPQMLRSMRATRSIEEIFQRWLNNE